MKILFKSVIAVSASAILFCSCTNLNSETAENVEQVQENETLLNVEELPDADIRNLKWGMTVDEVKVNETAFFLNEEYDLEQNRTLLNYSAEYNGLTAELTLNVSDTNGLTGVNYHIDGNYYQDFYTNGIEMYGEPDEQYDDGDFKSAWWYAPTEKYQVYIMFYDNVTSYDYWAPEDFETTEKAQTTTTTKEKKYCIVDGCEKEATESIVGISGQIEYYCQQHYDELEDLINKLLNSTNAQ